MKTNIQNLLVGFMFLSALLSAFLLVIFTRPTQQVAASVSQGSEYHATTTIPGTFVAQHTISSASGALGSIVITGAAAGTINLYDATTSDVTKRAASMSTTSVLVATMPVSAVAGTYTFDEILQNGLFVDIIGTMPTSTITYR